MKNPVKTLLQRWILKDLGSAVYGMLLGRMSPYTATFMADNLDNYISKAYAKNAIVFSVIELIIKAAIRVPWKLYEVKDEKALSRYKSTGPENLALKSAYRSKALEEIDSHKILDVWDKPNPQQGQAEWMSQAIGFKLATGNNYIFGAGPETGPNAGAFIELYNLPSQLMLIKAGDMLDPVRWYTTLLDQNVHIEPERICHRKHWTPLYENGAFLYGFSPIQAGSRVITRSNESYATSVALFQNQGPRGMFTGSAPAGIPALTDEQLERVKERLYEESGGSMNAGKAVFTSAHLTWQQMGLSPVDLAIMDSEKMDLRQICNLFNVASQLLNDPENKTYANQRDAMRALFTNAAIPELEDLRDELMRWWIPGWMKGQQRRKLFLDFDLTAIPELQDDMSKLVYALRAAWWLTPNQKLAAMNIEESEEQGMDQVWIPTNYMPISQEVIPGEEL